MILKNDISKKYDITIEIMGSFLTNFYEETYCLNNKDVTAEDIVDQLEKRIKSLPSYELLQGVDFEDFENTLRNGSRNIVKVEVSNKELDEATDKVFAFWQSSCFGFIDDAVFLIKESPDSNYINITVKSASRTGKYDFGKNKQHVLEIMEIFD